MPRNLERRVEILFPVEDASLKEKLWHILDVELKDTEKAHIMNSDGEYEKVAGKLPKGTEKVNSQMVFGDEAVSAVLKHDPGTSRVFIPEMNPKA